MTNIEYLEDEMSVADTTRRDRGITVTGVIRTIRAYASPILLTILAAAIAYLLGAVVYILMKPVQRNTTMGFRLEFPGADMGTYPNGLKFSGSDIIDTPVLRAAFDANQLERYMSFSDFSRSIVVLEVNASIEQLAREYEAKLGNPKLSTVERERLEAEYNQKRESLRKNEFSLVLTTREGLTRVPPSVASKTLADILRLWSEFAAKTRQVLAHRVPLVSEQALARLGGNDPDLFGSLLALRTAAIELQNNINNLATLPGAEMIRSTKRNASLRELELELAQTERSGVEFLMTEVLRSGTIDRARAAAMIESQLAFDRRSLQAAEERVNVLRTALEDYSRQRSNPAAAAAVKSAPSAVEGEVVPQVSDSFLERIVALAQDAADRSYRQRQIDEIRNAAMDAVPLRSTVQYEEQLLADLRSGGSTGGAAATTQLAAERNRIAAKLATIASDLNDIRAVLSRSLTASGQMYTVTAPAVAVTERSVSTTRVALGGMLVLALTTLLALAAAFVHHRLQMERTRTA
jgi:hypothetical protein